MPVPEGSAGEKLLRSLGYEPRWTSWVLALPEGSVVQAQPLPDGYAIRAAEVAEYTGRLDCWRGRLSGVVDTRPADLRGLECRASSPGRASSRGCCASPSTLTGAVVGISHVVVAESCAYVAKLAVRADQRRRGIARALLADSFAVAREHGSHRSELSTDSRTVRLDLYP